MPKVKSAFDIAKHLAEMGLFVCGGGVRDLYLGRIPKDLDTFVPSDSLNEWFKTFRDLGYKQKRRLFFKDGVTLDIVDTDAKSPIDIVEQFDCDVCKWYMGDEPIPLNDSIRRATDNMIATFDLSMDLFGTSLRRAEKLRSTGWHVMVREAKL